MARSIPYTTVTHRLHPIGALRGRERGRLKGGWWGDSCADARGVKLYGKRWAGMGRGWTWKKGVKCEKMRVPSFCFFRSV